MFEEKKSEEFDVLAEWTIRRLRPLDDLEEENYTERVKRWVLFSLGLNKEPQDIYLFLESKVRSTSTEIAEKFGMSPNTARKYLDDLHTLGLVDYVGREYTLTYESLSRAIELMLIPRITDSLRTIARGATSTDQPYRFTPRNISSGEIVEEKGVVHINQQILLGWQAAGKRVNVKSYGKLTIDDNVDPRLFDTVIEKVETYGKIRIPESIYPMISHKIRAWGKVDIKGQLDNDDEDEDFPRHPRPPRR
ncbi:HTH domain-containing protein [Candidatus Bathyarchaeota archaeon]|nr:HTH domain-containing protein [Candidatus Bathyarchaeota archaeon]